jgi:hypothetical protein
LSRRRSSNLDGARSSPDAILMTIMADGLAVSEWRSTPHVHLPGTKSVVAGV